MLSTMICLKKLRIGRTGRCRKTGIATTFINKNQSESILQDLKHLLKGAKQRILPMLEALNNPVEEAEGGVKGCTYCGGLGHRVSKCPKLEQQKRQAIARTKHHYFGSQGYGGEI